MDRKEVERHLYLYPAYKATITDLRRQYSQSARPEFGMAIQNGEVSDPTYGAVAKLHSDPEYVEASAIVDTIERVLDILDDATRMVVEETYFKGHNRTMEGIAMRCNFTRKHCWTIRQKAIDYFGLMLPLAIGGNKDYTNGV